MAHLEMIGAIVFQLTRNLTPEEIKASGFDTYFVDHTTGVYPASAAGVPFTAAYIQCKGDVITDLHEDLAAEQKARTTYDNILRFADDPDVIDPIRFLRQREVVHYQRFGEAKRARDNRRASSRRHSGGLCQTIRTSTRFFVTNIVQAESHKMKKRKCERSQ